MLGVNSSLTNLDLLNSFVNLWTQLCELVDPAL